MKICQKCGKKFPDEYAFCTECGLKLKVERASVAKAGEKPKKGKRIKAESVSVKPGQRRDAEAAVGRFFGEFRGDVVGILAYVDETTFAYLSGIKDARSFKILTSSFGLDRARIEEAARGLRCTIEVYEVTSPRKGREPRRILHERWISDGKLFVDLGTDLKSSALGRTQHTIRLEPAKNHSVELGTFSDYWEKIQAGSLEEALRVPVRIQRIVSPEEPKRVEARPKIRHATKKEEPKRIVVHAPAIKTRRGAEITAPAPRGVSGRETKVRVTRDTMRMVWEGSLMLGGLGLLIYSFLKAYGQMGVAPVMENVGGLIALIALGAALAVIGLRGAINEVEVFVGNAFGAAGLGLLMFSFLRTYELMGQTPQLANLVWLSIMIAAGVFLTVKGIPAMHELRVNGRKAWGSAFAGASLSALVLSILTIQGQVGKAPQLANVVWPSIMAFLGAFLVREGFPLVREPKDNIRTAWEGAFMVAGIGTVILIVLTLVNLVNRTLELANTWVWLIMLAVICLFLLAKGIGLVRE